MPGTRATEDPSGARHASEETTAHVVLSRSSPQVGDRQRQSRLETSESPKTQRHELEKHKGATNHHTHGHRSNFRVKQWRPEPSERHASVLTEDACGSSALSPPRRPCRNTGERQPSDRPSFPAAVGDPAQGPHVSPGVRTVSSPADRPWTEGESTAAGDRTREPQGQQTQSSRIWSRDERGREKKGRLEARRTEWRCRHPPKGGPGGEKKGCEGSKVCRKNVNSQGLSSSD